MTTITKERIELFIKNPLENGLTRGEQMELARIALASLEADPVAYIFKHPAGKLFWALTDESNKEQADVIPVYAAAPASVVLDNASEPLAYAYKELTPEIMRNHLAVFERYGIAPNDSSTTIQALRIALDGIERSGAMLHGAEPVSNHEELPLDYLQGQKDGLEWAAQLAEANHPQTGDWLYDDPLELAKAIRKGPDMPEFDGPTPVTPDGWISCSERMPKKNQNVLISVNFDSDLVEPLICSARYTGSTFRRGDATIKPGNGIEQATHWIPLPEPPQEAK
ncbi:TPA: DUF551 domain-containing protein [Escherichia coli]|uniref:DUF551 domain-containing protein n=1 Tax=Escherichia coli TaxID=562 RepID=UPI0003EE9D64|nr:DUF551 domain-containing protein [Escherichia coli]HAJ7329598.1 DUF551 domain-containing protein [Escherichia coli UCI 52]EFD5173113.1 DUF551 domain-containing protein [Escherichia coli]EFK1924175.1 DUF551 domain-containing protein [Escherichia coli]EFK2532645.1 DUF551 domain-containing protein [Escherichia coli]EFK2656461.1 DUF551 domain-containing protein [Escherichia coli]